MDVKPFYVGKCKDDTQRATVIDRGPGKFCTTYLPTLRKTQSFIHKAIFMIQQPQQYLLIFAKTAFLLIPALEMKKTILYM